MDHINFALLGLGNSAAYCALSLALVVAFRGSGTVNFAAGAQAIFAAYSYALLRDGRLFIPIPGLPGSIELAHSLPFIPALLGALIASAALGWLLHVSVFHHLRAAPPVARAVASVGVMLAIQAILALRLGTDARPVPLIFSGDTYELGDLRLSQSRLWTFVAIVAVATVVSLIYRLTRFGLATTAVSETEIGAFVSGVPAGRIAAMNWMLSSVVAGVGGVLIAPIVSLWPVAYTAFLVPALAAALAGRFSSIGIAIAVATSMGLVQSELTKLENSADWLPGLPLSQLVPLVVILGALVLHGSALPVRGALQRRNLGVAPRPRRVFWPTIVATVAAVIVMTLLDGGYRGAFIASLILAILMLSFVVVTGFVGQISLAQLALAGVGAFSVCALTTHLGVPFPLAPLLAALIAAVIGFLIGLPSLWVRGYGVAIATLALAGVLDAVWFRNNDINGGTSGARPVSPKLFGVDLGVGTGEAYPRLAFGIVSLVVLVGVAFGVGALRRSRWGEAMIAVSTNERSAAASGIRVRLTKCLGFALGAGIAGLAGSFMAFQNTTVSADSFAPLAGLTLFAMAYLAGITSISGAVIGGLIAPGGIVGLFVERNLHAGRWYPLIGGIGLILTVLHHPEGIAGTFHRLVARRHHESRVVEADFHDLGHEPQDQLPAEIAHATTTPDQAPLLMLDHVTVRYGTNVALSDAALAVHRGSIVGFIGPNGAGKTTLIDAVTGFVPHQGQVVFDDAVLTKVSADERARRGLIRTFQGVELYEGMTVAENIEVGLTASRANRSMLTIDAIIGLLGLAPYRGQLVSELSHGRRQLVSIARALAGSPKVLILDEPAAGLERDEVTWLARRLRAVRDAGVTICLVDHDVDFVLGLCDEIHVFDLGQRIMHGTRDEVRSDPRVIEAYLGVAEEDVRMSDYVTERSHAGG